MSLYFLMLPSLVHEMLTFYINGVLNCKCPAPGPKGLRCVSLRVYSYHCRPDVTIHDGIEVCSILKRKRKLFVFMRRKKSSLFVRDCRPNERAL